ncbi:MAG: cation:proton antiporter [Dehalogenimonas sp.]
MEFSTEVIADFAVIMTVGAIATFIFHRLKQPLILGYLIAGIIIGPYTPPFGFINQPEVLEASAELGVILLLFGIGLEFPLKKLLSVGLKAYAVISIIEIVWMFVLSFFIGLLLEWPVMDSLFLGMALASSSTVVIAKVLSDMGKLQDTSALVMMGVLVVEDLIVVLALGLATSVIDAGSISFLDLSFSVGRMLLFVIGSLVIGLRFIPRIIDWINHPEEGEGYTEHDEVIVLTALGFCFALSVIANFLDLSMAIGAFLMGVIIASARSAHRISFLTLRIKEMFGAMFFVSIGALIDITQFTAFFLPGLLVIATMLLGKVVGCGLGTRLMGYDLSTSLKVGLGMGQVGEFALIVAKSGQDLGVTSPFLFPIIGMAVGVTAFMTPYLIRFSYRLNPEWISNAWGKDRWNRPGDK